MNAEHRQRAQDEALTDAARVRCDDHGAIVVRYVAMVEVVMSDGARHLWRISGPEGIAGWEADGLLYAGLHAVPPPDEDEDGAE